MRRLLRDNGLSITMFALFLVFLVAQSIAGYQANNSDNQQHRQPAESYA
jgi:type II secretory pathway component PulL